MEILLGLLRQRESLNEALNSGFELALCYLVHILAIFCKTNHQILYILKNVKHDPDGEFVIFLFETGDCLFIFISRIVRIPLITLNGSKL